MTTTAKLQNKYLSPELFLNDWTKNPIFTLPDETPVPIGIWDSRILKRGLFKWKSKIISENKSDVLLYIQCTYQNIGDVVYGRPLNVD